MFQPIRLALILVLMLTSIGLGTARGTLRQGTEVVLCTGHGIVVTRIPGTDHNTAHVCPDMAMSLLATVAMPDVTVPQRIGAVVPYRGVVARLSDPVVPTLTRVRDPPRIVA
jgi:hypothetical protein